MDLEQEKFDHSFDVCLVTDADAHKIEKGVFANISEIIANELLEGRETNLRDSMPFLFSGVVFGTREGLLVYGICIRC